MMKSCVAVLISLVIFGWSACFAADDLNVQVESMVEQLFSLMSGEVVKGSETEVYIALGQKDGIMPGTVFEIIRRGEPLKVGEEVIGYEESPVGRAEVVKVRDRLSICRITAAQEVPQPGDRAHQMRKHVKRVLIGQFVYNRQFNALTKSLQEKLVTSLTNRGLQVVERDQLEKVLNEQKLGYSGLVNSATAKKIGELFGAEGMILGSVSDFGNDIAINARMVDVETGNALSAAEISLAKTPTIAEMLASGIDTPAMQKTGNTRKKESGRRTNTKEESIAKRVHDGFEFDLRECVNPGGTVTCHLKVRNIGDDMPLGIYATRGRLFDYEGNTFESVRSQVANVKMTGNAPARSRLISGITANASIDFQGVRSSSKGAALIEIAVIGHSNNITMLQFRDVPFSK